MGVLASHTGQHDQAARLWGVAEALLGSLFSSDILDRELIDPYHAKCREALGDAAYDAARAEGRALPREARNRSSHCVARRNALRIVTRFANVQFPPKTAGPGDADALASHARAGAGARGAASNRATKPRRRRDATDALEDTSRHEAHASRTTRCRACRRRAHRLALAQAPVEISFYYPVAVGGPITRIVDGLAAEFETEHPGIRVKPIYSEATRNRSRRRSPLPRATTRRRCRCCWRPKSHTLIDEDAVVPFDAFIQTPEDRAWADGLLSGLHGEQSGRRQDLGHSLPALDRRAVLEQGDVQGGWARSRQGRRRRWNEMLDYAQKLTKRDPSGKVTQWGMEIPLRVPRTGCFRDSPPRTACSS